MHHGGTGDHWLDALGRAMGATPDRRGVLRGLGGALGALLAGRGGEEAAASCKKVGQSCDKTGDCCSGAKCQGGECKCKSGRDECGGKCFKLDTDENHCGACNTTCAADRTCCGGGCANLRRDREHCGACGTACAAGELCLAGDCVSCPPGNEICGDVCCPSFRSCCDGTCVDDVQSNREHCGACGAACDADEVCDGGSCEPCEPGTAVCGNQCCPVAEICPSGTTFCAVILDGVRCCRSFERCVGEECLIA
jgi:hypothetical protein